MSRREKQEIMMAFSVPQGLEVDTKQTPSKHQAVHCRNREMTPVRNRLYLAVGKFFLFSVCFLISHIVLMETLVKNVTTTVTTDLVDKEAAKESSSVNKVKTAVTYFTKALDECRAIRLGHLLQTVPPNVDVWLLHNHDLIKNDDKRKESIEHVRRLERDHVLYNSSQANKPINVFDTKTSGASMSSYLRWVVQHPQYTHAWHMEDDVFFTGEWRHFFDHADTEADFVGAQFKSDGKWVHFENGQCSMDQRYLPIHDNEGRYNVSEDGRILCRDVFSTRSLWPFIRVSTEFAQLLLQDVESRALQGHHEAVVKGVLMRHTNLTSHELPPLEGYYTAGSWGRYKDRTKCSLNLYQPVMDNRYYHPVKCEAYTGKKLQHFKQVMKSYGWSNGTT
jgi:hypothetical protein